MPFKTPKNIAMEEYTGEEICIVGYGCVGPNVNNANEYWENILNNKVSIEGLDDNVFNKGVYYNKKNLLGTHSYKGAVVKNKKYGNSKNKLRDITIDATREALGHLKNNDLRNKKIDVFLGCMSADVSLYKENFFHKKVGVFEKYFNSEKSKLSKMEKLFCKSKINKDEIIRQDFPSLILNDLKEEFGIKGEYALFDAACASSLAAIDAASASLYFDEADMAITGGAETDMSPMIYSIFSRVGALSKKASLPLDGDSDGMALGEGAAIFVLQKLKNAIADGNKIYGIVDNIGSSSDGNASSFFSPSAIGQKICLDRAYKNYQKDKVDSIVYMECHATGTKVGDSLECQSLNNFFTNKKNKTPIGSVKSLIGHTRGAAGAFSLLKSLLIIKNKIIPKNSNIKNFVLKENKDNKIFINEKNIALKNEKTTIGISSFGFGNINYHLVLENFIKNKLPAGKFEETALKENKRIVTLAFEEAGKTEINRNIFVNKFRIAEGILSQTDNAQLLALISFDKAFKKLGYINPDLHKSFKVISCLSHGLSLADHFSDLVISEELKGVEGEYKNIKSDIQKIFRQKYGLREINEDISYGTINNVVSDRISNFYNFNGKNFNIDANLNSLAMGIKFAKKELMREDGLMALLYADERYNDINGVQRENIKCLILSNLDFAKENNLPILYELDEIK